MIRQILILLFIFSINNIYSSNTRLKYSINENWRFSKGDFDASPTVYDDASWDIVAIPHTYNNADAADDQAGFYQGNAWYRKSVNIPAEYKDKQVYAYFEGANQIAELYINGKFVGKHIGGYTRFCFDLTPFLEYGKTNQFAVKVNNAYNPNIPPLSADFTFFGGIYRDVYLLVTHKSHISVTDYASSGVSITTPVVSEKSATVNIKTLLSNRHTATKSVQVEQSIYAPSGSLLLKERKDINLESGTDKYLYFNNIIIDNPQLWDTDSPNLYSVYTRIYDTKTKELIDEVYNPLGLRWFSFNPEKGAFLNGKNIKLIGTSRHQDYLGIGNALKDEMHVRDVLLLKEMGGNFLRVAHYPQDPVVMEMCDKLGIITSVEIPVVNAITQSDQFTHNSLEMIREMIRQDMNRPSIFIWSYMNEVMLRPPYKDDEPQRDAYNQAVGDLGKKIETLIRKEDPYRYTMLPCHGNIKAYKEANLTQLPMILGWNLYQGWYSGAFTGFENFVDNAHREFPDKVLMISEYGADVDLRLHSFSPERFDYTVEYGNLYHEHYLKEIMKRDFIAIATIWNLNDFYSETRQYATPHINSKGITTLDRQPKDTYFLYQAKLSKKPVLAIGSKSSNIRGGVERGNTKTCIQPVPVYSNSNQVELFLNGRSLGTKIVADNIARFDVPFVSGKNQLKAVATIDTKLKEDFAEVEFRLIPSNLKDTENPFTELNVMLGSKRYFEDQTGSLIWIPEQEYTQNSWGYIGGKPYRKQTKYGSQPASEINIIGESNDPLYQTQRVGIEEFRADVPHGEYSIYFYWAELDFENQQIASPYNLGNDAIQNEVDNRIFDVNINGNNVFKALNLKEEFGAGRSAIRKCNVTVSERKGLSIKFSKIESEPVLNAIRIYRNY